MTNHIRRPWLALLAGAVFIAACTGDSDSSGDDPDDTAGPTTSVVGPPVTIQELPPGIEVDTTALSIDPAARTGTLDNGLRYYVRSNDAPGSQLQLRLVVRAGSVQETADFGGLAHFTEHMMFNGTEEYPRNTLNDTLRSFGTEFGADLNAYTSYDETVYLLSVPRTDDEAVEAAFDILDQWAEHALITEEDTVGERGVVREEFRARAETADGAIFSTFDELYTADSSYVARTPIGGEEAIESTTAAQVREFYDRWYRPDLMAVIAVGDLALERLEQEILDRFSDNTNRGDGAAWTAPDAPPLTDAVAEVLVHPDGPDPFVSLDYSLPSWPAGTVGGERRLLLDEMVAGLLQQRLDDGAARGTIPIVRPSVATFEHNRGRRFLGFNFVAEAEDEGLTAVLAEVRAMQESGFAEGDLERVKGQLGAAVDQMLATAASRQDNQFASDYVEHFLAGAAIDAVEDAHARLTETLASIDADEVSEHFRVVMERAAPLVVVVGSDAAEVPSQSQLLAAIEAAATAEVAADADDTAASLPAPPDPVQEVGRQEIAELDAVALEFANGATVIYRYSEIAAGQVDLLAAGSGGWSLLAPGEGPLAAVASAAVDLSGVGDLDSVDLDRALAGTVVEVTPYIEETADGFFGSSGADDVELMFLLLHLMVSEPRVDPGPLAEALEAADNQRRASVTSPEFASLIELLDARYGGDPYQALLADPTALDALDAAEALRLYRERLGKVDDLVIAVVGDTDVQLIEQLARTYIGTLPGGPADSWVDRAPAPPEGVITREVGAGTNDAGAGFDLLMTTEVDLVERQRLALPVLQNIINDLLVEQVREALGASYSGGRVFLEAVDEPDVVVELLLSVSGDPDRVDEMHTLVLALLGDLATDGPTEEQFDSAHNVVLSDLEFINNFSLLEELLDWANDGSAAVSLAEGYQGTLALTAADVAAVAAQVIDLDRRVEVFRRP